MKQIFFTSFACVGTGANHAKSTAYISASHQGSNAALSKAVAALSKAVGALSKVATALRDFIADAHGILTGARLANVFDGKGISNMTTTRSPGACPGNDVSRHLATVPCHPARLDSLKRCQFTLKEELNERLNPN